MDASVLQGLLHLKAPVWTLTWTESTNAEAKKWALDGAPHGACILAQRQTLGRGRLGREFFSPEGGLYMSVILRTARPEAGRLTALAAVTVCRAVERETGCELTIKWVNDVLLDGLKVCGILSESTGIGKERAAVIGVGINIAPVVFPSELKEKATAVVLSRPFAKERVAAGIVNGLVGGLVSGEAFMDEYRARCVTLQRAVRFTAVDGKTLVGWTDDVDDEGALIVRTDQGIHRVFAGEVFVQPLDGSYA